MQAPRRPTSYAARAMAHMPRESHSEAVALLGRADSGVEKHRRTLLNVKSRVAYTHQSATSDERKKSRRAAEPLVEAARRIAAS
jgi:hypothetical protein